MRSGHLNPHITLTNGIYATDVTMGSLISNRSDRMPNGFPMRSPYRAGSQPVLAGSQPVSAGSQSVSISSQLVSSVSASSTDRSTAVFSANRNDRVYWVKGKSDYQAPICADGEARIYHELYPTSHLSGGGNYE